jgi:hypothetical protein
MTPKEQLIQAIQRSPDSIVQELLEILQALHQQLEPEKVTAEPARQKLERMGGIPKHLLNIGGLSDRDHRRDLITEHLQKKYRQDS